MTWWMEIRANDTHEPKRGDLIQSARGSKKERTWFILWAKRRPKYDFTRNRFSIWRVRWWELEPDFRMRLYRSAQRHGGQVVWYTYPLPSKKKKKKTFEEHMERSIGR